MNSRERVEKVLRHELPDRIPNGWGGCETAGLHVLPYRRLVNLLGLPERPAKIDTFMFNAVMDADVLGAMSGDILLVASPRMCAAPLYTDDGWHDVPLFGTRMRMTENFMIEEPGDGSKYLLNNGRRFAKCPKGGYYFDTPGGDLFEETEIPDPSGYKPVHSLSDETLRNLEETARRLYEETEFALCMGETIDDLQLMPGGMIGWYDAMLNEPEIVDEYLEKQVDAALDQLTGLNQAVGRYCCMLSIAHDLGDARGVTMGTELFRSAYKKHYARLFRGWHARTDMKINLHSCGSIIEILPDLIECGVDVLNPVQLSANGMTAERIKAIAGDKLVLYGGALDCIQTPDESTDEAVYVQVRKNIETLSKGGNYLFAGVHNTAATTSEGHLRAALRAYRDIRNY